MSEKVQITITGVEGLLDQGKSRKEIAEHYGITMSDCKRVFMHPKLKGRKAKKIDFDFILVDDTVEASNTVVEETVEVQDAVLDTFQTEEEEVQEGITTFVGNISEEDHTTTGEVEEPQGNAEEIAQPEWNN